MLYKYIKDLGFKPKGVVHLGAQHLQELDDYLWSEPEFIIWAECNPELYSSVSLKLLECLRKYPNIKQRLCPDAIYNVSNKEIDFFIYNHPEASSVFREGVELCDYYPGHSISKVVKVKTITVDDMLDKFKVDENKVDYLSMDVQGAELLAIEGAVKLLTSKNLIWVHTEAVYNQYYDGGANGKDVVTALEKYGFEIYKIHEHSSTYSSVTKVNQSDILFKRKNV